MKESDKTEWKYIAAFVAILAVGTIAFIVLVGEKSNTAETSTWGFLLGKGISLAVLYGCTKAWKLMAHSEMRQNMEKFLREMEEDEKHSHKNNQQ